MPSCNWVIRIGDVTAGGWPAWNDPLLADAARNGTHGTVAMRELIKHATQIIPEEARRLNIAPSSGNHLAIVFLVPMLEGDCRSAGGALATQQIEVRTLLGCAVRGNKGAFGHAAIIRFPKSLPRQVNNPTSNQALLVSHELAHLLGLQDLTLRYKLRTRGQVTTTRDEQIRLHPSALMGVPFRPRASSLFPQECRYLLSGRHDDPCGYGKFVESLLQFQKATLRKSLGDDVIFEDLPVSQ